MLNLDHCTMNRRLGAVPIVRVLTELTPLMRTRSSQKGAIKDELSLTRAPAQWYAGLPAVTGLVLNKNETPFAPLYWDRYEQIKTPGR